MLCITLSLIQLQCFYSSVELVVKKKKIRGGRSKNFSFLALITVLTVLVVTTAGSFLEWRQGFRGLQSVSLIFRISLKIVAKDHLDLQML